MVGPGSVGACFAAHLIAVGHDVVSCARRPFDRYEIESKEVPVSVAARVLTDPAEVTGPVDVVFVGVKAHQTAGAAGWFANLCGPQTTVVVVQNGIEGEERLTPYANGGTVVPAVVYCGAELLSPGHVAHASRLELFLPDTPAAHAAAALFDGTPAKVVATPDYLTESWRKLGLNVVVNGLTALTQRTIDVLARPDLAEVARAILAECWTLAEADGAKLNAAAADPVVNQLMKAPGGGTSMYYDRRDGRPTEHDALYGAVVRAGQRLGIPTPMNAAIGAIVSAGDPPVSD